jgi:hypothetical protein
VAPQRSVVRSTAILVLYDTSLTPASPSRYCGACQCESRRASRSPAFVWRSVIGYAVTSQVCQTSAVPPAESRGERGAGGGTRTHKGSRPVTCEVTAFTGFATPAPVAANPGNPEGQDARSHKRCRPPGKMTLRGRCSGIRSSRRGSRKRESLVRFPTPPGCGSDSALRASTSGPLAPSYRASAPAPRA